MNHLIDFISVSFFIHNFRLRQHTYFMKKQKHLPDFTRLCKPEQNTIQNILSLMIFFFFTGSVCGYVWEVLQFYFRLYYPLVNYCQILQENIRKTTLSLSFSSLPF